MVKNKDFIERGIRRIITSLHQEVFGKGPEESWVKINKNIATFSCTRTLTPMEIFLLGTQDGKEEVKSLRIRISSAIKERLTTEIDVICGIKILSITDDIHIDSDTWFGAIILQSSIE
ncbi:MAG: Na-translocating system protein MpsC family protein [Tepidanaerobacteraceae bacterium]|nr:Na-translocating system protein MpsC family protein [Tepidanaerobacteraceae bacterium]